MKEYTYINYSIINAIEESCLMHFKRGVVASFKNDKYFVALHPIEVLEYHNYISVTNKETEKTVFKISIRDETFFINELKKVYF